MAEVDTGGGKKVSTKVDMTPMVDLAFLLITFFMLTTTFSKPKAMEVNMPDKVKDPIDDVIKVKESLTTTFVLGEKDIIYYYSGKDNPNVNQTDYSDGGLRRVVLNDIKTKVAQFGQDPVYIIKASKDSRYKNVVDMLDEMAIAGNYVVIYNGQERKTKLSYALVDITKDDEELIEKAKGGPTAAPDAAPAQ
jgi:biopolymer transport protein ExbD